MVFAHSQAGSASHQRHILCLLGFLGDHSLVGKGLKFMVWVADLRLRVQRSRSFAMITVAARLS